MDERLRFVARLLDGEKMAVVCAEFGISRKTGYKIYERYKDAGVRGLTDRSRRPYRHANQLPMAVEKLMVRLKREYPSWGAPKLRERLKQRWPDIACPPAEAGSDGAFATPRSKTLRAKWTCCGGGCLLAVGDQGDYVSMRRRLREQIGWSASSTVSGAAGRETPALIFLGELLT